jgi:hypothetical protein
MKNIILILIIATSLFSCEKTVNIKIPDNGRKLTVNSFFSKDSNLVVSLSKSRYILDGTYNFESVEDADISFFENNNLVENLNEVNPGIYKSNFILQENNNYRIEVSSKDFPVVNCQSSIPGKTEIISLSVNPSADEYGNQTVTFKLKFQDDLGSTNYYFIQVFRRVKYTYYDEDSGTEITNENIEMVYIDSDDPNVFQEDWALTDGLLMSGELINGREYTLSFASSSGYYYEGQNESSNEDDTTYFIYFHSVSKDYYLYYKSLSKHRETKDEFFMEPVQVYNNIENGFGIFAGYSTVVDSVKVE